MPIKLWINPLLVGLLILFSLPLKLPILQHWLENLFSITLPVRLSLYTFFLPPTALLCLIWNRGRTIEIWDKLKFPLIVIIFLFCWMWLGALMSDYPEIALKHSGRYSIMLLTFLALLFALDRNSIKRSGQIFTAIYVFLMALTFLDLHGKISILDLISDYGLHIDLFFRGVTPSSFFENRNPYAVASVALFFWNLANLKHSLILSSLGLGTALYSIFLAGSRNGILTLSICLLILLYLTFRQKRTQRKGFTLVIAISVSLGVVLYSLHSQAIDRTISSFKKLLNVESYKDLEKLDVRFTFFRAALESGIANPTLVGTGTKTFHRTVISKSKDLINTSANWYKDIFNAHNFLLTIWIEMGLVGLIAVLIFLWLWLRPALRGPPLLMMPMLAVCVGQILDYFIWEIFFMAFQSFFFAHFASSIYFLESENTIRT
tara:strand:+ start:526 stop:1824 length:1299 start_codon:yes stop_codon:yes gene_type:complete